MNDHFLRRFEFRHDWSNSPTFAVEDETAEALFRQDTASVGLMMNFEECRARVHGTKGEIPMRVLLVSDKGHLVASMENLEQYDASQPGDMLRLMDFMETLIAAAKGSHSLSSAA